MRKNKGKVICLVLSILMLSAIVSGCSKSVRYEDNLDDYVVSLNYSDGFTILQLTDLHWSTASPVKSQVGGCEKYLKKVIAETKAHAGKIDLIEITGDTFMLSTTKTVNNFIEVMEEIGIPYAIIWGNHDREGKYNPNWLSEKFKNADHCLYVEVDHDNVHERGNYIINLLKEDGSVAWQIANMDSGASYREGAGDMFLTYDYFRQDQFDWLTAEHQKAGQDVPVICYYHIAQADNDIGFEAIQKGNTSYYSKFFKLESFAASDYAPETEDVFLKNHVVAAFMGHAHADDFTFTTPSGITYGLGVKTGKELYYGTVRADDMSGGFSLGKDFDLIGASLVTLTDTTGQFSLEHLYLNELENGDFIHWEAYR